MKLLSALVIPAVMLLVCAMLTFSKKAGFDDFLLGTNEGIVTCVKLLPTLIALLVAVSMLSASGDTVLYISAVYFGSVGIKKTRHTLLAALLTMIFCVFFSSVVCSLLF